MRAVHTEADWPLALKAARREALTYFGNDTLIIEKLINNPRHIEIQLMADHYGNIVHLFERDCSMQRRHQKIIEEAPAINLTADIRQQLTTSAINIAREINYLGAGTVEFLVTEDLKFYFIEMNTRLQVEHPVTEAITGLDLVEWQLRIAAREPLPQLQPNITAHGHAIECRLYAEDPITNLPSVGTIDFLRQPDIEHVRIDSAVIQNDTITPYYDALLSKVIAWGETRDIALCRLQQALNQYQFGGIKTNKDILQNILHNQNFLLGNINTNFLTTITPSINEPKFNPLYYIACIEYIQKYNDTMLPKLLGWRMHTQAQWYAEYQLENNLPELICIIPINKNTVQLKTVNTPTITLHILKYDNCHLILDDEQQRHTAYVQSQFNSWILYLDIGIYKINHKCAAPTLTHHNTNTLTSPIPATVVAILTPEGTMVKQGQALMIVEAMKMEHTIYATHDACVTHIFYKIGDQVSEGIELLQLSSTALGPNT